MKNYFKILPVVFSLMLVFSINVKASTKENPIEDCKEVLYMLLTTVGDEKTERDIEDLRNKVDLSDKELEKIKEISLENHEKISTIYNSTEQVVGENVIVNAELFNDLTQSTFEEYMLSLKTYLGENKYKDLMKWITDWWKSETTYRMNFASKSDVDKLNKIFATQYNPHIKGNVEVAVPDRYVKFANLGWTQHIPEELLENYSRNDYKITVIRPDSNAILKDVLINDVGPWNTHDNYWDDKDSKNPRRDIFAKLPLGVPGAYAAFYDKFNDGKDEKGRKVVTPAALNLSVEAAKALGLKLYENAYVEVIYKDLP